MKHITIILVTLLLSCFIFNCNSPQKKLDKILISKDKCTSAELVDYLNNIDSISLKENEELLFKETYTCGNEVFDILLKKCLQFNLMDSLVDVVCKYIDKAIIEGYYSINCTNKEMLKLLIKRINDQKAGNILLQHLYLCDEELVKMLLERNISDVSVCDVETGLPILYESYKNKTNNFQILLSQYNFNMVFEYFKDTTLRKLLNKKNYMFMYHLLIKLYANKDFYKVMKEIKMVDKLSVEIKDTIWLKNKELNSNLFCFLSMRNYPWMAKTGTFDSLVTMKQDTRHPFYELNGKQPYQLQRISKYTYPVMNDGNFYPDKSLNYMHFYDKKLMLLESQHEAGNPPASIVASLWESRGDSMKMIAVSDDYIFYDPDISFDCEVRMKITKVDYDGPELLNIKGMIYMGDEGCYTRSENFILSLKKEKDQYSFNIDH